MKNDIAAENINKGDVFFVLINKKYFFMQIIHIAENVPPPYDIEYKFGYFIVVFDKTFTVLPNSIEELDLQKVYLPKYIWKKTTLYASIWNKEPNIQFDKNLMHYDYKDKFKLTFFANTEVSEEFIPKLAYQFSMPAESIDNSDGIQISHTPLSIQTIIWALLEDEKKKSQKRKWITPIYFQEWIEYADADCILKTEKALTNFDTITEEKRVKKELKKAITSINKIEEKFNFITTIEAENIYDKLVEIAIRKGLSENEAIEIIETEREW
ncbi:hypothetical protein [Flavobacterium sp. FlaQc-48]|uniref:hypothetical protein n=1 Tax=Flavobacterium sp. FlaQc-48 TaxID=3374181 RepID=UPI003756D15E